MSQALEGQILLNTVGVDSFIVFLIGALILNFGLKAWKKNVICFGISIITITASLGLNISNLATFEVNTISAIVIFCMFPFFFKRKLVV